MSKKINVIQFLPYFPPHKGGLETHAEEWATWWTKKGYGNVINVTCDVGQKYDNTKLDWIIENDKRIGYKKDGVTTYLLPSFDLVYNFPVVRFWTREYRLVKKALEKESADIIIGRTRFFLTAFMAGIWARLHGKKWVHIEHGSDFVLLESKLKTFVAYLYDQTIGRIIFRFCDQIICVSEGGKVFLQNSFGVKKDISVIYRGADFVPNETRIDNGNLVKIGFIGRLVKLKGVDILVEAFHALAQKNPNIMLEIVGNGDMLPLLEARARELSLSEKIKFLGEQPRDTIAKEFLPHIDILVNPSFQEGLPTSVIEGLLSGCVVVATDVGGTREISESADLILIEKGKKESLVEGLEKALLSHANDKSLSKKSGKLDKFNWNNNIDTYYQLFLKQ